MRTSLPRLVLAGAMVQLMSACSGPHDASNNDTDSGPRFVTLISEGDRKAAPALEGQDLDGKALSTSDFSGKVIVVNLWGQWCAPCRAEAPVLKVVADEYASRNVQFVGIVNKSDPQAAKAFNSSVGITYPSFADQGGALELSFRSSLPTTAIPTTWVLDSQGRVAARIIDPDLSKSTLSSVLDEVVEDDRPAK